MFFVLATQVVFVGVFRKEIKEQSQPLSKKVMYFGAVLGFLVAKCVDGDTSLIIG